MGCWGRVGGLGVGLGLVAGAAADDDGAVVHAGDGGRDLQAHVGEAVGDVQGGAAGGQGDDFVAVGAGFGALGVWRCR